MRYFINSMTRRVEQRMLRSPYICIIHNIHHILCNFSVKILLINVLFLQEILNTIGKAETWQRKIRGREREGIKT